MSDLFYVFGIALTVMAVVVSFIGLRSEKFPDSRALYAGVLALFGGLVVASAAFAIVLSREEAEHRSEEVAEFEAEQAEEADEAPPDESASAPAAEDEEPKPAAEALALSSPADGALVFEPTALKAAPGEVSIEYTNPSAVPHNVAIEAEGATLAQGETVTDGDNGTATADLDPGEYVFFCSIPGHREAGMEGTLAVE